MFNKNKEPIFLVNFLSHSSVTLLIFITFCHSLVMSLIFHRFSFILYFPKKKFKRFKI